ncbi:MAG: LysR family transcriptional regulator, partial [Eubacteriales bacterium]|nr:LysR family transcriptional regulator [Eubacteriales bacterium]
MTIRHLKLFIAVVDYKTMSNAAKKMFISQPSVSQAIREIEEYYDLRLFERLSQKLYLTIDGEKLLKYARHIVSTFENMEQEFRNKDKNLYIRIGGSLTFGTYMLPEILIEFEKKYPNVQTKIMIDNTNMIEEKLLSNEIDIGIVEGEIENEDILEIPIYEDKMVIVTGYGNALANKDEIDITE